MARKPHRFSGFQGEVEVTPSDLVGAGGSRLPLILRKAGKDLALSCVPPTAWRVRGVGLGV